MSRFVTEQQPAAPIAPRRSVYEDPGRGRGGKVTTVVTATGRYLGLEIDGKFFPASELSCCDDPARCERPECWTRIGSIGEPGALRGR